MTANKRRAILEAVEVIKNSEFKATAIKVELEAQFGRHLNTSAYCSVCVSGRIDCPECQGTAEDSDGGACESCNDGRVSCPLCNTRNGFYDNAECHKFLMKELEKLGLAKYRGRSKHRLGHGVTTSWWPTAPLAYAEFYIDGSVDSEFTFTIMLDNPKNIFLLPKIITIWNKLGRAIGNGCDVAGAGMHMALINDEDGDYPTRNGDPEPYDNFSKEMLLLMPALYFLGASCSNSRGLNYRYPGIGWDSHRAAIDYRNGALEFRVFDTCYKRPEAILDNVVVIKNCLKFWADQPVGHKLAKIVQRTNFGIDSGDELKRFYLTKEHLDLLNAGLKILKPNYCTITELKEQRQFKVTKNHVNNREKEIYKEAITEYKEYEERFDWSVIVRRNEYSRNEYISAYLQANGAVASPDRLIEPAEPEQVVESIIEDYKKAKTPLSAYIKGRLETLKGASAGEYVLDSGGEDS